MFRVKVSSKIKKVTKSIVVHYASQLSSCRSYFVKKRKTCAHEVVAFTNSRLFSLLGDDIGIVFKNVHFLTCFLRKHNCCVSNKNPQTVKITPIKKSQI